MSHHFQEILTRVSFKVDTMKQKSIAPNRKAEFRLFSGGMFILMMIALFGCQQEINVPPHLIGVWQTSTPKHKDRHIEFTDNALIFHIDDDEKIVNVIKKIKFKEKVFLRLYTFYYQDSEGEKWTLSLSYDPYSYNGVFQLQNSLAFWRR